MGRAEHELIVEQVRRGAHLQWHERTASSAILSAGHEVSRFFDKLTLFKSLFQN